MNFFTASPLMCSLSASTSCRDARKQVNFTTNDMISLYWGRRQKSDTYKLAVPP